MRFRFQAKPEAVGLIVGTIALLIASTSSILVVCAKATCNFCKELHKLGYLLIFLALECDFCSQNLEGR